MISVPPAMLNMLPKLRAGPHHDVFHHVAGRTPALRRPFVQHTQIMLEQDHACRLLGYVHCAVHRDPTSAERSEGASLMPSPR